MKDVLASDTEDTYETYCGKIDVLLADMPDGTSQRIYARGPSSTGQYYGAGNVVAVLSKILGTSASLIGLSPDPRGTTNGLWRMLKDNGKWQPVEWINPPMELGTEYRTTERYLGKPVYCKVVDFGTAPNNDTKNVSLSGMNIDEVCDAIFHYYVPRNGENGVMTCHPNFTGLLVSNGVIQIRTNADATDTNFYVTIKYTKITD